MSSERIADRLDDILTNVARIAAHLDDVDEARFLTDSLIYDAVERCLERVCEAVTQLGRLGVDLDALEPDIRWADIRGLGNRLRHAYHAVDPELIWVSATRDLAPLDDAVRRLQTVL